MAIYNDLHMRCNMNDNNSYPKPNGFCHWMSPDIIVRGINIAENPEEEYLGKNFNQDLSNPAQLGMHNYIYLRGKNYVGKEQKGEMRLYWAPSSLLLSPALWSKNVIESTQGKEFVQFHAKKDAEYVTSNDDGGLFNWVPITIKDDHYCLVARVITDEHPAPIPKLGDIHDFAAFMYSEASMGYAQRNISIIQDNTADYIGLVTIKNEFRQQVDEGYIVINCENLPTGCEVAFTCPKSSSSCYLDIVRTKVVQDAKKQFSPAVHFYNMPSGFESEAYLNIWFNGIKPTNPYNVTIDIISIETPNTAAYHLATPLTNLHIDQLHSPDYNRVLNGDKVTEYLSQADFRKAIRVGSCSHVYRHPQ